jgi:MFS family permease
LQGPYIYTLYKDEKGLVESTVAALFMTGFISAAISASFSGSLADKYGRRLACLAFCCIYSLSCLTVLFNDLIILFIGRVLGGISTTLMYSVFESWMVTEYHHRNLAKSSLGLSSMFGLMTTLNSAIAVGAGLIGQVLVSITGTKTSPFMAAIVSLGLAGFIMIRYWVSRSFI